MLSLKFQHDNWCPFFKAHVAPASCSDIIVFFGDSLTESELLSDRYIYPACPERVEEIERELSKQESGGNKFFLLHRHALGQVSRLVNVAAFRHGNVVREELERHDGHKRQEGRVG